MECEFYEKNVTCCTLELHWINKNKEKETNDSFTYELSQKEKGDRFFVIYVGKDTNYRVTNLNPSQIYVFMLTIIRDEDKKPIKSIKTIKVKTLNSPKAILSENSFIIFSGDKKENNFKLSDSQVNIIKNCSKLIFQKNNADIISGIFDGIEVKIACELENHKYLYYISFDILPEYFESFFVQFINEWEKHLISPCNFIINKLPTILIFNLLEKGPVIFTGKRMGGVIASSLAYYIMYIGQTKNIDYGNSFSLMDNNSIGVVTFGSPSFLTNLYSGYKMKELASYFYNIKEEFDYIPEIIDFTNYKQQDFYDLIKFLEKPELSKDDINNLKIYLEKYKFTYEYLIKTTDKFMKIPFGYYFIYKSSNDILNYQNEYCFDEFYYSKPFQSLDSISHLKIYEKLSSKNKFNNEPLLFLKNKNYEMNFIKVITRRKNNHLFNKDKDSIKGIIKITLTEFEHNYLFPDIIYKIQLISNNNVYEIENKDIFYDNNTDITAYINGLNEKINSAIIINNFGGEIKVKNILNIIGSGSTVKMLKYNIEKLFLFPFFKLIEIFYSSVNNKEKYEELKKQYFGENFEDLKILKQFEKQIQTINELLFLSRPDIIGNNESYYIEKFIRNKKEDKINVKDENENYFIILLKRYYKHPIQLQIAENINCLSSQKNSIAEKISFPQILEDKKDVKKLFMCQRKYFEDNIFYRISLDDSYIKTFFINQLIKETLISIEEIIKKNLNNKNNNESKKYLNLNIGKIQNELIEPYIDFTLILILTSIENGEKIKFNHDIDSSKLLSPYLYFFFFILPYGEKRAKYEEEFKIYYNKNIIEKLNMQNLYNKIKIKDIIDSNINSKEDELNDSLKIFKLENEKSKIKYYNLFLRLFNNYPNDFPEDIEISIFDNLKEENKLKNHKYHNIKEIMNELINDNESKRGFLALVRQAYLLGKLRTYIVSK